MDYNLDKIVIKLKVSNLIILHISYYPNVRIIGSEVHVKRLQQQLVSVVVVEEEMLKIIWSYELVVNVHKRQENILLVVVVTYIVMNDVVVAATIDSIIRLVGIANSVLLVNRVSN